MPDYPFHNTSLPPPRPPLPPPVSPAPTVGPHLQRRAAVQRPTISTAQSCVQAPLLPTPASARSVGSPFSPYAPSSLSSSTTISSHTSPMSAQTGSALVAAYNPREWNRHGPAAGAYVPHSTPTVNQTGSREWTGMEASMPSPPPPYTPSPSQSNIAQTVHYSPAIPNALFGASQTRSPSGVTLESHPSGGAPSLDSPVPTNGYEHIRTGSGALHQSPVTLQTPSFPPPPPRSGRDRSTSRTRPDRQHTLFSFSALSSRNRTSETTAQPTAIDSLRQNTTDALARAPLPQESTVNISGAHAGWDAGERDGGALPATRPPASRRAASAGAIGVSSMPVRDRAQSRSPSQGPAWEPGMPLPPPPPGPPPSGSRSQSMSRTSDRSHSSSRVAASSSEGAFRRPHHLGSSLGPVPPTPADWVDENVSSRSRSPAMRGLHIETGYTSPPQSNVDRIADRSRASTDRPSGSQTAHPSSTGGITRTPARREPSARGIRERRSESRAERERTQEVQSAIDRTNPWAQHAHDNAAKPADLVLPPNASGIVRRRVANKTTPTSGRNMQSPMPAQDSSSSRPNHILSDLQGPDSSHSTPRQEHTSTERPQPLAPTPPFSPSTEGFGKAVGGPSHGSPAVPPKTLPTPPTRPRNENSLDPSIASLSSLQSLNDRPVSHILHAPNDEGSMPAPLIPSRPPSAHSAKAPQTTEQELFAKAAAERHEAFIRKESSAQTDRERLELFADFMVAESRIRRDRYSRAFDTIASDILDLTRDMWRSYNPPGRRSTTPNASSPPSAQLPAESLRSQSSLTNHSDIFSAAVSPQSTRANFTPRTEADSPSSMTSHGRTRGESLTTGFQPCLSPIPSMAQSTVQDDGDSRGRTASRWWEASADGSIGRGGQKIERSRRESKYMGLPKEARECLQWDEERSSLGGGTPGPSQPSVAYGANEYPLEKSGLHDQAVPQPFSSFYHLPPSAPATPHAAGLDVSRLVTLPPPYPRHYPAVNNNHPDLASIRANLRMLGEFDDATATKERHRDRVVADRERDQARSMEAKNQLRNSIQERVRSGSMSFADAAKAEADFDAIQARRVKDRAQAEFDSFEKEVMTPLHALFSERATKASASIEHVRSGLFNDAEDPSPNQTQEGGDEQPELLEKLTLLKWLFETREQLHRELFELEGKRNDYYKNVILTPYRLTGNEGKIRDAENFFARDGQDRRVAFESDTLRRTEDFMGIIERNVTRGVEVQLSAFWDIAPGLLAVVQKVPHDLDGFDVQIPAREYEENPAYVRFPQQYLYTLLAHAEKSAYQFIESQTNLLCLLHEVKSGVMMASSRLLETQRHLAGEDYASVDSEMRAVRKHEEARLTEDLKEKAALVEGQWGEALGKGLGECKDRVQAFLIERGGWDEGL